jgi:imidazolonepropionase
VVWKSFEKLIYTRFATFAHHYSDMKLVVKNIGTLFQIREEPVKRLAGAEMAHLPQITDAWLFCEDGKIHSWGKMATFNDQITQFDPNGQAETEDARGGSLLPAWCDSHTHIVFAEPREQEFVDRIHGLTYEEIARRGGGILNSARKLANADEGKLYREALSRIYEMTGYGTGAVEIKSGYGLSVEAELKMLRVIKKLKENAPVPIKATFLGAHAIPSEYRDRRADYIKLITDSMLPQIAEEGLADYCDVFCDRGFFTPQETETILEAGWKYNLRPKIHANELDFSGGIQVGVKHNALSVDHLEFTGDEEIRLLKNSETMATILPSTAFFLKLHYAPARKMIDEGLSVALATDYNPGSSPSGNIPFVLSLSCIYMGMTPEEAINAATINGAYAMDLSATHGSVSKGKSASFLITRPIPSLAYIPYSFGANLVDKTFIDGKKV